MARISEETIQRVAEASDIVEVIGSYFPLKRAGTSWRALCPFHREKTPSFHVNPQRQSFHCFGCGAGGTVFRFVMDYEHVDFPSAVRRLAQRSGVPVIEEAGGPEDDGRHEARKRLLALHAEAAGWFHHNLLKSPAAQPARDYLKGRGITVETAKSWQLGFAPDSWDALLQFLREKRFTEEEIAQSGLAASKDEEDRKSKIENRKFYARFRARVMFPIRNDYGEVIAFSGRVLDPEAKTAKYVNSPETPIFTKGRVLYGLDKSKRALIEAGEAIVCEGQLDLISAYEAGVRNVIAPQGTAFTAEQARVLARFAETAILCFDSDRAGQEAVTRSLPALLECGLHVKVVRLPEGEDPDSLIRGQGADAFRAVVGSAKDFFDHALEVLEKKASFDDPSARAAAVKRLAPYLAMLSNPVLREARVQRVAQRLGLPATVILGSLPSAAKKAAGEPPSEPETGANRPPPIKLSEGLATLCCLALASEEARAWLLGQKEPKPSQLDENGKLLEKILAANLPPGDASAFAAFISRLPAEEERALSALDLRRVPENAFEEACILWNNLVSFQLNRQLQLLKNQLREPGLAADRMLGLQKQILDLQRRLNDLFRPLPEDTGH